MAKCKICYPPPNELRCKLFSTDSFSFGKGFNLNLINQTLFRHSPLLKGKARAKGGGKEAEMTNRQPNKKLLNQKWLLLWTFVK